MTITVMGSANKIIFPGGMDPFDELPIVDVTRSHIKAQGVFKQDPFETTLTVTIDRNSGLLSIYGTATENGKELPPKNFTDEQPVICQVVKKLDNKF